MYTAGKSQDWAREFHYPEEPLIKTRWILFIRKSDLGRLKFDSFDDLKGRRIGVVRGYRYTPEFWNFLKQEKNYEEVALEEHNFRKLEHGRIDYVASEYGVGNAILKKVGLKGKIIGLEKNPIRIDPFYILFNKNSVSPEYVKKFSDELRIFKSTARFDALRKKYFK